MVTCLYLFDLFDKVSFTQSIEKPPFCGKHSLGQERMDYLESVMGDSADLHNKVAGLTMVETFCLAKC